MKVFHGLQNIGGMAGVLARAQRALGVEAESCCLSTGSFAYKSDRTITASRGIRRTVEIASLVARHWKEIDVFQFYFGESLSGPRLADVPWLRRLGKKVFFYFCGCDIRNSKVTIEKYEISACRECWPMACSANRKAAIATAHRYADGVFVSTPDLLEFVPGGEWLPQPIDLHQITAAAAAAGDFAAHGRFTVAHAPSNRMIKGTAYLEAAVEKLQDKGLPIELMLIENMPYAQALTHCSRADLVVDQLLVGSYGQFAVEMMALGKPVICYLRDDVVPHYPATLPVVNARPDTIADVLERLYRERDTLSGIGRQGISYARTVHDSRVVAAKTLSAYGLPYQPAASAS